MLKRGHRVSDATNDAVRAVVAALRMEGHPPMGLISSDTSQESQSKLQTSEEELSAEEGDLSAFEDTDVAEVHCLYLENAQSRLDPTGNWRGSLLKRTWPQALLRVAMLRS